MSINDMIDEDNVHNQTNKDDMGTNQDIEKDDDDGNDDDDDDDELSIHIEKMKLNLEEPAFLPSRKHDGSSSLLNSLRMSGIGDASSTSIPHPFTSKNQSIPFLSLHLKQQSQELDTNKKASNKNKIPKRYSDQRIENDIAHALQSSHMDSVLLHHQQSNKSDKTDDEIPFTTSHNTNRKEEREEIEGKGKREEEEEEKEENDGNDNHSPPNLDSDNNNIIIERKHSTKHNNNKMTFGPNLNRTVSATHSPPDESSLKENNSALNSVGSSFSDLSDSSITQSALEDALMSRLNNGSKMSSLAFSRKY
ncbi:hypothetical protein BJ944DRAFT_262150 [Cunninghamella echinulata]|nr:hypothetical protein BJ944DRAFT_262150 [Cunninghamella echinulata]